MGRTFYLVRHGETDWNRGHRYQGHKDIPLNDAGRRQAQQLAEALAHIDFTAVYASDLKRAYETAAAVARAKDLPVQTHEGLREMAFGRWEGLTFAEIEKQYPEDLAAYRGDPAAGAPPEGESFLQLQERVVAAWEDIIGAESPTPGKKRRRTLIVAHGGALKALICHFLGLDPASRRRFILDNVGITKVALRGGGRPLILAMNVTSHVK